MRAINKILIGAKIRDDPVAMNENRVPHPSASPIDLVRLAESEIKQAALQARQKADAAVKAAEQRARELLAQAAVEGEKEGARRYAEELEKAKKEADEILIETLALIRQLEMKGDAAIQDAVMTVLREILPGSVITGES